jgi:hypothetical protein
MLDMAELSDWLAGIKHSSATVAKRTPRTAMTRQDSAAVWSKSRDTFHSCGPENGEPTFEFSTP